MRVKLPIRLSAHVWRCPGSANNADSRRRGSPGLRELPELPPQPSNVTFSKATLYDMAHGRGSAAKRSGAIISQSASYTKVNMQRKDANSANGLFPYSTRNYRQTTGLNANHDIHGNSCRCWRATGGRLILMSA